MAEMSIYTPDAISFAFFSGRKNFFRIIFPNFGLLFLLKNFLTAKDFNVS